MTTQRVTRDDAADYYGVSLTTIDRRITRGELQTEEYMEAGHKRIAVLVPESVIAQAAEERDHSAIVEELKSRISVLESEVKGRDEVIDTLRNTLAVSDGNVQQLLKRLEEAHKIADDLNTRMLPGAPRARRRWWRFGLG